MTAKITKFVQGNEACVEGALYVATGSVPVEPPGLAFDGKRIVNSTDALCFDAVPGHLGLVGGGYIGLELGSVWLPLVERGIRLSQPRRVFMAISLFGAAMAAAAFNVMPVQIAFLAAALIMVVVGLISVNEIYASIDWPIIILLGAMFPLGNALVMAPGGYRFGDYWRLGLPLSILVVAVAVPLIAVFWAF